MEYHVAKNGSDRNPGTIHRPFETINRAASVAAAGDVVTVHEGVYREWVDPRNKGLSDKRRIVYQAAAGEKVVIKGSERIRNWQHMQGNVWKVVLPNAFFGDFNPYTEEVFGDWLVTIDKKKHLGEIYLNGMSFYEVQSFDELLDPAVRTDELDYWTQRRVPVPSEEQTRYVWYTENDTENTTLYANFQGADPNDELVEINVRRSCFYPTVTGVDYITVRGFEMSQAATPWAPPTADQPGLLGANWSKGWIIEGNTIHDAKCSAISIGKEGSTGHNYRTIRKDKPGYQYQLEAVFSAERIGWSKEKIGSHTIRNNTIYDCGQNAIVGHLGCVFSNIHHNHIYNIALKREFFGYEIAGIKLHAAIDVHIHHNRIHDCVLGLWSDWETQGTRISKNIFYNNTRDLFVEVSHGPYLVDHNILASAYALDNWSQGGAFINNLICGVMVQSDVLDRSTQYHVPHSTKVAGFSFIFGGDDRFYNNIFTSNDDINTFLDETGFQKATVAVGTTHFNGHPASLTEYIENVHKTHGDHDVFMAAKQPVYINNNAYFNGARPFERENDTLYDENFNPDLRIIDQGDEVYLSCKLPDSFASFSGEIHSTVTLPRVRIVDAEFENPDGSDVVLDTDLLDRQKTGRSPLGPVSELKAGTNHIRIWQPLS
ncbi:MAG: right-handed parallel beta-helix repeat-containing protein [Spirochaetota bacterium]